jgi:hypothetical protein
MAPRGGAGVVTMTWLEHWMQQRRQRAAVLRMEREWTRRNRPPVYTVVQGYDPATGPFAYVEGSAQDPTSAAYRTINEQVEAQIRSEYEETMADLHAKLDALREGLREATDCAADYMRDRFVDGESSEDVNRWRRLLEDV